MTYTLQSAQISAIQSSLWTLSAFTYSGVALTDVYVTGVAPDDTYGTIVNVTIVGFATATRMNWGVYSIGLAYR